MAETQQLPSLPGGPGRAAFAFIYYCGSCQALTKPEHNSRLSHHLAGGSDRLAVGSVGDPVGTYRGRLLSSCVRFIDYFY